MPTHANALAVMVKAPVAGQVKTRLLPALSAAEAAELYRCLLTDQLNHLSGFDAADLYVAFAPEDARAMITELVPKRFRLFAQRGDDLGARMNGVFDWLHAKGHRNKVLIGSDLAPVPLRNFTEAFTTLEVASERVVLGPSRDGGYYLVGMNRLTPQIFDGMTWSHDRVLAQTTAKLNASRIEFQLLPTWFDIDTVDDLRLMKSQLPPDCASAMKLTLELLRRLGLDQRETRRVF